jgi:homoserine kinase type II
VRFSLSERMAVYTHLSHDELQALAARYGFGPLQRADGIAEGVENSNFLIEDAARRAILTVFEKRVAADELPFFMTLMQHLSAEGVPCPTPLLHDGGKALSEAQGKPVCVVSFLEGKSKMRVSVDDCRALGAAMARMHLAGQSAPMARANDLSLAGWQTLFAKIEARLEDLQTGLRALIAQELTQLQAQWPSDLPRGIIHADLFPNNVFFDEASGALSGIIDFYFACEDVLAYDIAICLNCWCFDEGETVYNCAKAGAMLAGYESVRTLSDAERKALPLLARGAALRFLLTRAHDVIYHDESALVEPHDPMEYVQKLAYWKTQ